MLTETVQFTDFNGKNTTENLYFNITKADLLDNITLMDDVEIVRDALKGEERELKRAEIKLVLDVVKKIMKLAYGERSEDGRFFRKNEQIWDDFTSTAAYDAFIMSLFENPEKAAQFIVSSMPSDLVEQVKAERGIDNTADISTVPQPGTDEWAEQNPGNVFEDFTREQLLNMPDAQFASLVPQKLQQMTQQQLQVAMQRKAARDAAEG